MTRPRVEGLMLIFVMLAASVVHAQKPITSAEAKGHIGRNQPPFAERWLARTTQLGLAEVRPSSTSTSLTQTKCLQC